MQPALTVDMCDDHCCHKALGSNDRSLPPGSTMALALRLLASLKAHCGHRSKSMTKAAGGVSEPRSVQLGQHRSDSAVCSTLLRAYLRALPIRKRSCLSLLVDIRVFAWPVNVRATSGLRKSFCSTRAKRTFHDHSTNHPNAAANRPLPLNQGRFPGLFACENRASLRN